MNYITNNTFNIYKDTINNYADTLLDVPSNYVKGGKARILNVGNGNIIAQYISFNKTVDLGLPSGNLWATYNLGANYPWEPGLFFQWADTQGYKGACSEAQSTDSNKETHYFGINTYKYYNSSTGLMTKYIFGTLFYPGDSKTVLESEDDAATVMLGEEWRTPSQRDFVELLDNTEPINDIKFGYVDNYGGGTGNGMLSGWLRKSKINGNIIFLPDTGYYEDDLRKSTSVYWTNERYAPTNNLNLNDQAYSIAFISMYDTLRGYEYRSTDRWLGCQIRPVKIKRY